MRGTIYCVFFVNRNIHIDEPVIMRYPEKALNYGIDDVTKCFSLLPENVTKIVHFCRGYPTRLDQDDYLKVCKHVVKSGIVTHTKILYRHLKRTTTF